MKSLPPLDTHAHVATDIPAAQLEKLGAVTLIATRSLAEFHTVQNRQDLVSIWGVGCHPALVGVQRAFDPKGFEEALASTPFVAEVGLDGGSRVPIATQEENLLSILGVLGRIPRLASFHSYQATSEILALLQAAKPTAGRVMHWWLGDTAETRRAVELGCYFSVNFSMMRLGEGWKEIPLERMMFETDHPSGDRFSESPRQPGRIQPTEELVARHHGVTPETLRRTAWTNFAQLVAVTQTLPMLPVPVQRMVNSLALDA